MGGKKGGCELSLEEKEDTQKIYSGRQYERAEVHLKVRLQRKKEEFPDYDWLRNLSMGGAFIETRRDFHVGDVLDFEIFLEGGISLIQGKARVVRKTKEPLEGIGIQFQSLTQSHKKKIQAIIEGKDKIQASGS